MPSNKIIVKLDSVFNTIADAVVIPRSTVGTISDGIRKDLLKKFRIELPEILEYRALGSVDVTQHINQDRFNNLKPTFYILMATCVDNNMSTYEAIQQIAQAIAVFTKENPQVRDVAVPLLGTGSGRLDHMKVFQILTENFINYSSTDAVLEVCITDDRIYNLIRPQIPSDRKELVSKIHLTPNQPEVMNQILEKVSRDHNCYLAGALWDGVDRK